MLKSKIRKKFLELRKREFKEKKQINFNKIYNLIKNNVKIKKDNIVGGYYPVNFEIDDLKILQELEKRKIRIALPKIKKNFSMEFYLWSFNDPLSINKYGIPEPILNKEKVHPDILIVPMVAFDSKLNRLGYGGGYYDRKIKLLKKNKNFLAIGLAFNFQKHSLIPVSKYDEKLDYIVTNQKIFKK